MKKSTITDLSKDIIKAVPHFKENELVMEIIRQAQAGEFHDFKNTTHVCGKVALVQMLQETNAPELLKIIKSVMNGDYDESPDEDDKAQMKKDWLADGGTEDSYNKLFGE
jgi:hypothetical protein